MEQKIALFQNKGMTRDISISKVNNELAYENFNVRITARDQDTLLSVTNEKGNKLISLQNHYNIETPITIDYFSDGEIYTSIDIKDITTTLTFIWKLKSGKEGTFTYILKNNKWYFKEGSSLYQSVTEVEYVKLEKDYLIHDDSLYPINIVYHDGEDNILRYEGTEFPKAEIKGILLGNCVLNNYLILFTHESNLDHIYRIEYINNSTWTIKELFNGNLNFNIEYPLETIASYESEEVQKIYWTDGINQPRVINIKADYTSSKLFDFIPYFDSNINVSITKEYLGTGYFPSSTIQYFITYFKKFGQETKIVYSSPLYYNSNINKGASPEEICTNQFTIKISDLDTSFDFIRVYSVIQTALEGKYNAYIVGDFSIQDSITVIDLGKNNISIDYNLISNLGGEIISAYTMAQKDNTLFLGNLSINRNKDYTKIEQAIKQYCFIHDGEFIEGKTWECKDSVLSFVNNKPLKTGVLEGYYPYENQLKYSKSDISYFKGGEKYRFAVQFEDKYGIKTKAFWIGDKENKLYPEMLQDGYYLAQAILTLPEEVINTVKDTYNKVILLRAETSFSTRSVLAQGILNPTLFNLEQRYNNQRYSIPSWFMRPDNSKFNTSHFSSLASTGTLMGEIQCNSYGASDKITPYFKLNKEIQVVSYKYIIAVTEDPNSKNILHREFYYAVALQLNYSNNTNETKYFSEKDKNWKLIGAPIFGRGYFRLVDLLVQNGVPKSQVPSVEAYMNWETKNNLNFPSVFYYSEGETISKEEISSFDANLTKDILNNEKVKSVGVRGYNVKSESEEYVKKYRDVFFIDRNIVTFDSPDIDNLQTYDNDASVKLRIVGTTSVTGNMSDYYINYSKPVSKNNDKLNFNFSNTNISKNTEGLVAAPLVIDSINPLDVGGLDRLTGYMIYPWHKNGSITNYDTDGVIYTKLENKIISNLRFSKNTSFFNFNNFKYPTEKLEVLRVINATESQSYSMMLDSKQKIYTVNNDFILLNPDYFNILQIPINKIYNNKFSNYDIDIIKRGEDYIISKEGVRVSYKSGKHILLSLGNREENNIKYYNILPEYSLNEEKTTYNQVYLPWEDYSIIPTLEFKPIFSFTEDIYTNVLIWSKFGITTGNDFSYNVSGNIDIPYSQYKESYSSIKEKYLLLRHSSDPDLNYVVTKSPQPKLRTQCESPKFTVTYLQDGKSVVITLTNENTLLLEEYKKQNYKIKVTLYTVISGVPSYLSKDAPIKETNEFTFDEKSENLTYRIELQFYNPDNDRYGEYQKSNVISSEEISPGMTSNVNTVKVTINPEEDTVTRFTNVQVKKSDYNNLGIVDKNIRYYIVEPFKITEYTLNNNFGTYNCGLEVTDDNRLLIGELYIDYSTKDNDSRYGGITESAVNNNKFIPIGSGYLNNTIIGKNGDSYIQRWDCLKTFPFTKDSTNSVVDITSFMVETYSNIDGRYDDKRGQQNNLFVTTENFNLINPVYSQEADFISSFTLDSKYNDSKFPYTYTFSTPKYELEDIDSWTKISLASSFTVDSNKGKISAIRRFQNSLIVFQDKGIAEILFNSRTQLSTKEGVPIEIGNSGKVEGNRYITNSAGCLNKWSIVETQKGIYFIDNINSSISIFNGNVQSLSEAKGFKNWIGKNNSTNIWNPESFDNFIAYYDRLNDDVYFIKENENKYHNVLCFNETLMQFTSFFNYGKVPMMINLQDKFISFKDDKLWIQHEGEYSNNFGELQDFHMIYRVAPNPYSDKTFSTIEYKADMFDMNSEDYYTEGRLTNNTFDSLEVWNEYQGNKVSIDSNNYPLYPFSTIDKYPDIRRKFRIWRMDIPRDKKSSNNPYGLNRIRNPWIYLKLSKDNTVSNERMEFHDLAVRYFE